MQTEKNLSCHLYQYRNGRPIWHILVWIILLLPFVNPLEIYAQLTTDNGSNVPLAEKIYLQTDRQVYPTNDTIWFKGIVASAFNHKPTALSGVLYAELVAPTKQIVQKKLIKLTEGLCSGFFSIDANAHEGTYQLRAYTQWDLNFGSDFIFTRQVSVFASTKQNDFVPISNVALVKTQGGQQQLRASFDPLCIDSLHNGKLTVYLTVNGKTDSMRIGKGDNGKYLLEHQLDDSCRFVTLKMQTDNLAGYAKTVLIDKDYTDLQFFPESGELVHGLPSKVGFKAVDVNGKGIFVRGDIVDGKDAVITTFESNTLGMGSFALPVADTAKTYYARLASKLGPNHLLLVPLPRVNPVGNTLSVERRGDRLLLVAASNYLDNINVDLVISCRGMVYFNRKVTLKDGVWGGAIPSSLLPDGIIACTMLDNSGQPVAERLFFNQRPNERLQIELITDKAGYAKREKTNLNLRTTGSDGEPVNANLSVLVINKDQLGKIQRRGQNILSYFLLDSELKGEIENPGYYFNGDENHDKDLDALMLTQGWRRYLYSKPCDELPYKPEKGLSITGRVTAGLFEKEKQAKLTMMSFGDGFQAISAMTDSVGKFCFNLDEEYGDKMGVVIQSANEDGKKMNYTVSLDKKRTPPVTFDQPSAIAQLDSVVAELVKKDEERKKVDDAFRATSGTIMIGQVDVDGYKRSPMSKSIIERFGEPDEVIDGEELQEREEDWSYGLYNVLTFNYKNTINIQQDTSFNFYAAVMGSDKTLVLVDGDYDRLNQNLIATLPTSEVSSIDIIDCVDDFRNIYLEKTDSILPLEIPIFCGSIMNINTVRGKGILDAYNTPKGINRFKIPVFSTPKEHYSPNYETLKPEDSRKPDLRSVLHWQPLLATDNLGMATTSFYNADNVGDMLIVVEGISDKGKIGYAELGYKVEGKQDKLIIVE